jgi:small ligand-binding sensory domain FIST
VARVREDLDGAMPHLVLAFVSPDHDSAAANDALAAAFPGATILGASARSVIGAGREVEEAPGLALAAARLPDVAIHPFHLRGDELPAVEDAPVWWRERLGLAHGAAPSFLLLADPFSCDAEALVGGLDASFPADERDRELFRSSLFLGIEMKEALAEYHPGDFLVRNLVGLDARSGALVVGARLHDGQVVQFHLRDAETSARDLEERLARYRSALPAPPSDAGALLFSCLGRGQFLYGRPDHDSAAFARHLGRIPLAGFFCNGEIGPVEGRTFLHGYTSAFAIFRRPRRPD